MNFITLETNRLFLIGLTPKHMTEVFETLPKAEIMELLGHRSEAAFEKEAHKQKNGYAAYNRSFLMFLMRDKTSNAVIGRCGFHNWNVDHRRAEIGYAMEDESYKQKGLMKEALEAILHYGFTEMNLHRVEALVGDFNVPSLRLMEIFGFEKEGVLREHYLVDDKHVDSLAFSLLQKDWNRKRL